MHSSCFPRGGSCDCCECVPFPPFPPFGRICNFLLEITPVTAAEAPTGSNTEYDRDPSQIWNQNCGTFVKPLPLYQVVSFNLNIIAWSLKKTPFDGVTNWCELLSPDCVNNLFRRSFKLDSRGPEWSASARGWVLSDQNWISDCRMLHTLGYGPCILLGMAPAYFADPTSSDWQVVRAHNTCLLTFYHKGFITHIYAWQHDVWYMRHNWCKMWLECILFWDIKVLKSTQYTLWSKSCVHLNCTLYGTLHTGTYIEVMLCIMYDIQRRSIRFNKLYSLPPTRPPAGGPTSSD